MHKARATCIDPPMRHCCCKKCTLKLDPVHSVNFISSSLNISAHHTTLQRFPRTQQTPTIQRVCFILSEYMPVPLVPTMPRVCS